MTGLSPDGPQQAAAAAAERLQRAVAALSQDTGRAASTDSAPRPRDVTAGANALGELLFAVAALAAAVGIDAESTLREACQRFQATVDPDPQL